MNVGSFLSTHHILDNHFQYFRSTFPDRFLASTFGVMGRAVHACFTDSDRFAIYQIIGKTGYFLFAEIANHP